MPTTNISTIRHAHTEYNAQRRYAGSIDVTLSQNGVRDAKMAAQKLTRAQFDVVVSSPMQRALATARILARDGIPVVTNPLCVERNFGLLEGRTWDDLRSIQPPVLLIQVGFDLHTVNPKGAEPFEDVWQRAREFRRFLFTEYRGAGVLVVSHGVFLQLFNGLLRGLNCIESLAFPPSNLELFRFTFEGDQLAGESVTRLGSEEIIHW